MTTAQQNELDALIQKLGLLYQGFVCKARESVTLTYLSGGILGSDEYNQLFELKPEEMADYLKKVLRES